MSETRLDSEHEKIRTETQITIQFHRLPVQLHGGEGQTQPGTVTNLIDSEFSQRQCLPGLTARIPNRPIDSYREASSIRWAPYETDLVCSHWRILESRKGDLNLKLEMVAPRSQCPSRSATRPTKQCTSDLYRHFN